MFVIKGMLMVNLHSRDSEGGATARNMRLVLLGVTFFTITQLGFPSWTATC